MRIIKYWDRVTDSLVIYYIVREESNGRKLCAVYDNMGPRHHEIAQGAEMPAYMRFPRHIAEAMGLKADDDVEEESVTREYLDDATTVRDRLLTLVEGQTMGDPAHIAHHIREEAELRRTPPRRLP